MQNYFQTESNNNLKNFLVRIAFWVIIIIIMALFFSRPALPVINRILGMPDLSILEDYRPLGNIEIYDYKDEFVGVLQGEEDRQVVKLSQISDYAIQAVLAAEDSEFFKHHGFSLTSIGRALATNIKAGRVVQGGSTISQQMVKNLFIKEDQRYERTMSRKVKELLIAFEVENRYSKEKILEIYLNQVYFGNLAYGIERASQRYFSKPASKLTLLEASYLAGLLTAPTYMSKNLKAALERQRYVLQKMFDNGYINKQDYDKALKSKLEFKYSKGNMSLFPFYFSYVEQQLMKRYSANELKSLGLKVYTALDPIAQKLAEESLDIGIKNAAYGINQGALVTIDVETGEIRALVGGVGDYWSNQYNRATGPHTLGSAFKPFVYLTAFAEGLIDPSTIIVDDELRIPDVSQPGGFWVPQNFDEEYHGSMTVRAALTFSRNIPAIKTAMKAGMDDIIDTAHKAGLTSKMEPVLSTALGSAAFSPLEVATAYSTLARGGVFVEPILIRKVVDRKGKVMEVNKANPKSKLSEIHVSQLVSILKDVVKFGTGTLGNIPNREVAGKTGTADGSRDIWFVGFTPDYVTSVWCGNERNKEVLSRYATGGSTPAWVFQDYMTKLYDARPEPVRDFNFKEDYKLVAIDPLTGLLASKHTPNPVYKRFIPGTEPKEYAPSTGLENDDDYEKEKFYKTDGDVSSEDKELRLGAEILENTRTKKSTNNVQAPKNLPIMFKAQKE
jgi:1A family penicillin-binding protein